MRIRNEIPVLLDQLKSRILTEKLDTSLRFGERHKVLRLTEDEVGKMEDWFFIGDIHGDFFALHCLLNYAEQTRPECRIFFLGDMVDRGDHPVECIFLLLDWGLRHPGRLAWIAGNHDIAITYNESTCEFISSVRPSEILDYFNRKDEFQGFRRQIGKFFIQLGEGLPRALLFPDGLLATHGGIPHTDLFNEGSACADESAYLEWLNSPACLKDFTWLRIHRAPKKIPNRHSSGAEYGHADFEGFCALKPGWFPVRRLITGHQHPAEGFAIYTSYKVNPAMTLIGFGFAEGRPLSAAYANYPELLHIAQGRSEDLPQILQVPVDRNELKKLYPDVFSPSITTPVI